LINVDALLATATPELLAAWGSAAKPTITLTPLAALPPADAGIVAALGPASAHHGRKWFVCGAVGGIMRKLGFPADRCEAVVREWLGSAGPGVNVDAGVKHALGAWQKPASEVSGVDALAEIVGREHADVIAEAAMRTRRPNALVKAAPSPDAPARDGAFSVAQPPAPSEEPAGAFAGFDCTRQGTPRPSLLNASRALECWFGPRIRFDECRGRVLVADVDESLGRFPDGLWTDVHTTEFRILCERHGLALGKDMAHEAIVAYAHCASYNPLTDFLIQCAAEWDGMPRVDGALTRYWRCADDAATRACSRVWFLSLAARGLEPGCKVDTALVLLGEQGLYKSQSLRLMAGGPDWFADSPLPIGDKDAMQNLRGKWIWEIGENSSVSRRDANAVKAFLSAQTDTFRASFGRFSEDVARTCTFVVTSNLVEILNDPTGARRWLPVRVGEYVDLAALREDRVQLLGEAARRVLRDEQHWPTDEERAALAPVHEHHTEHDPWEEILADWIAQSEKRIAGGITLKDVFAATGPIPMADAQIDRVAALRAGTCLRRLGFERSHGRDGKRWVRKV
jgi:hypothetical protein